MNVATLRSAHVARAMAGGFLNHAVRFLMYQVRDVLVGLQQILPTSPGVWALFATIAHGVA